jgi:hypothetical protein
MKTTRKDFEAFKAEFLRWQKRLGLLDWRTCFAHDDVQGAYAEIVANKEGRVSTVFFTTKVDDKNGAKIGYNPVAAGRHEALELLLAEMKQIARARNFTEDGLDAASHAVIRRLENLFDNCEAFKC